ncbi:LysR family transcriptional regulator [Thauera phenylacetica B4P]|uniref:LysR family transcriptional regulator n=1 Tax=Thauera phenylacetica B4P TaxID=1234382 RepID=N6ZZ98_9RHOO|nr:LysR family transcriptional regulator [Thauera phenylacetica B4P]
MSRQISLLEDYLGVQFFHRDRTGVRLTEAGERYLEDIGPAFERIAMATRKLTSSRRDEHLRLRVYSTFAAKWLMRRMADFQHRQPDVRLRIMTAVAPVDFSRETVDASIQFGDGTWPGVESTFLFGDELRAVCNPGLLPSLGRKPLPRDVLAFRLIHSHYRSADWPDWLKSAGIDPPQESAPFMLPNSLLAYQAASDGLGIAIAQTRMVEAELSSGTLVYFSDHVLRRPLGYYLVTPPRSPHEGKLARLRAWLLEEISLRDRQA